VSRDQALSPEGRAAVIEIGLQADTLAIEAHKGVEPMIHKASLLREKAKLTSDPTKRQALEDEAAQLKQKVKEMMIKAREAAGANP
jgi:hypothetical protein